MQAPPLLLTFASCLTCPHYADCSPAWIYLYWQWCWLVISFCTFCMHFFFFFTLSYLKITLPSHPFVYSINLGWRGAEGRLFAKTPKISLSHWQVWKSVCPNTINRKRQQPKHGYHQFSISKWNNDEEADNTIIFQIHNCTVLSHVTLV